MTELQEKPIELKTWEEFEEKVNEDNQSFERVENQLRNNNQHRSVSKLLFRGLSNACYPLETTLERFQKQNNLEKEWPVRDYRSLLERIVLIVNSETFQNFELPNFEYSLLPNAPTAPQATSLWLISGIKVFPHR